MNFSKIIKNKRFQILIPVLGFVIIVLIVLIIIIPTTKQEGTPVVSEETTEEAEETTTVNVADITPSLSNDPNVTEFFDDYYKALADGNASDLVAKFDSSDNLPDVSGLSTLVDGYENIKVYTAPGMKEDELAAFVYSDVKLSNIDTTAPSVDSFYLVRQVDGPRIKSEMYTNPDIANYLNQLAEKEPVKSIMDNTEKWMETSLSKDDILKDAYEKMKSNTSSSSEE